MAQQQCQFHSIKWFLNPFPNRFISVESVKLPTNIKYKYSCGDFTSIMMWNSRCKVSTKIFGGMHDKLHETSCHNTLTRMSRIFLQVICEEKFCFVLKLLCMSLFVPIEFLKPTAQNYSVVQLRNNQVGAEKRGSHSSVTQAVVWTWCFDIQQFIWVNWVTFCCMCQISDSNKIMPSCAVLLGRISAAAGKCRPRKMTNFQRVSPACFL